MASKDIGNNIKITAAVGPVVILSGNAPVA